MLDNELIAECCFTYVTEVIDIAVRYSALGQYLIYELYMYSRRGKPNANKFELRGLLSRSVNLQRSCKIFPPSPMVLCKHS